MIPGLIWGATKDECAERLPCDEPGQTRADRAISIDAAPAVVFGWLCQLRVSPYSYDLLDNWGRPSPRERDQSLSDLEPGQSFITLFRLRNFAPDEHITLQSPGAVVTYAVRPEGRGTRLRVRVIFRGPKLFARALALGDLVMMRKQLLTLKSFAERECAVT